MLFTPPVTNCHIFSDPLHPPRAWRTLWTAPQTNLVGAATQVVTYYSNTQTDNHACIIEMPVVSWVL